MSDKLKKVLEAAKSEAVGLLPAKTVMDAIKKMEKLTLQEYTKWLSNPRIVVTSLKFIGFNINRGGIEAHYNAVVNGVKSATDDKKTVTAFFTGDRFGASL